MYEFKHAKTDTFDDYLRRHLEWGHATFGTPADGRGPLGPLDHIRKEVDEVAENPHDLKEWIDLIILSIDGFLRAGGKLTMLLPMLFAKQTMNALRNWPDWRTADPNKAIEHVRTEDEVAAKLKPGYRESAKQIEDNVTDMVKRAQRRRIRKD